MFQMPIAVFSILAPHFYIVSGTTILDISLDPTASASVSGNAIWKLPSINGMGRLVNNWIHICGGGSIVSPSIKGLNPNLVNQRGGGCFPWPYIKTYEQKH